MKTFSNKVALVTGAAAGIGRAIALRLADAGMDLYLIDINLGSLEQVTHEARSRGVTAVPRKCDVSKVAEINACVSEGLRVFDGIDLLVNNAGITYFGSSERMCPLECDRLMAINLLAPIRFTQRLLPTLLAREEAHILNVASFFGLIGTRKLAAYTASKFGVVGYSESLRAEYARTSLGVSCLCPGFVDTGLFDAAALGDDREFPKRPPQWMLTTPARVAERAFQAIRYDEALVVMQAYVRAAYWAKRFAPGLLDLAHHLSRKKLLPTQSIGQADESQRQKRAA